jgi:hypothetical protein
MVRTHVVGFLFVVEIFLYAILYCQSRRVLRQFPQDDPQRKIPLYRKQAFYIGLVGASCIAFILISKGQETLVIEEHAKAWRKIEECESGGKVQRIAYQRCIHIAHENYKDFRNLMVSDMLAFFTLLFMAVPLSITEIQYHKDRMGMLYSNKPSNAVDQKQTKM